MKRIILFGLLVVTTTGLVCMQKEDDPMLSPGEKKIKELEKLLAMKKSKLEQLRSRLTPAENAVLTELLDTKREALEDVLKDILEHDTNEPKSQGN